MLDLKMMTPEEINEFIHMAEKELKDRATVQVEEKKAKVVIAIRELIAVCRSANIRSLGSIEWECFDCDYEHHFDILNDEILHDVAKVLEGN